MAAQQLLRLAGNSGWSLLVQGVRATALAVVLILLARHLGPEEFGVFAVAFSIVKIFSVVAGFGLERAVVRRLVQGTAPKAHLVAQAARIRLVAGLLSYGLALGTATLLDRAIPGLLVLVAIMGPVLLLQAAHIVESVFQAEGRFRLTAIGITPTLLLFAIVKILAMAAHAPLVAFAWLELLEGALLAANLFLTYAWSCQRSDRAVPRIDAKETLPGLVKEGFPMLLAALAVIAYMRADLLMLGAMLNSQSVGIYSAAAQLSEVWTLLPVALMPALLPQLLKLRELDREKFHRAISILSGLAAAGALAIAFSVTFMAPWLVTTLFGEDYSASIPVLRIHVWSVVFIYLAVAQSAWDIGENRLWLNLFRTAAGAVLNIFMNFLLIPVWGPVGAAVATLVSYSASAVWLNAVSPHSRGVLLLQIRSLLVFPLLIDLLRGGRPILSLQARLAPRTT